jgi:hypothetical protein
MSARIVRSINDFMRHRMDVDAICYCGHRNTLPRLMVFERFSRKGWPRGLEGALAHFRCSRCGSCARHIGPRAR